MVFKINSNNDSNLVVGSDFREHKYRRETFIRFYQFHLKYKSHPGAVYYVIPELIKIHNLNIEQQYWLVFLNGCCQNIITSWILFENFSDFNTLDIDKFSVFFRENYTKFGWDTDRRYVKNKLENMILNYKEIISKYDTQHNFFTSMCNTDNQFDNFDTVWKTVIDKFYLFGRLSTFSYLEYLKIIGLNICCSSLFLHDLNGSKSHRNGLCKVLGRDDLDWHSQSNPDFDGKYDKGIIEALTIEGGVLLSECIGRFKEENYINDVNYFTLESTLCCYKSWYRKNRRYPNVYNDMFHDRIKYAEIKWNKRFDLFWNIRHNCLPEYLLFEYNPRCKGVHKDKQNHFRNTGQVVMLNFEHDCFKNDYNDTYYKTNNQSLRGFVCKK